MRINIFKMPFEGFDIDSRPYTRNIQRYETDKYHCSATFAIFSSLRDFMSIVFTRLCRISSRSAKFVFSHRFLFGTLQLMASTALNNHHGTDRDRLTSRLRQYTRNAGHLHHQHNLKLSPPTD